MPEILIELDTFAVKFFERFAHWFQRQTGRTNFFLSKVALAIFISTLCVGLIIELPKRGFRFTLGMDFLMLPFYLVILLWYYDSEEYLAVRRLSQGVKNPLKINWLHRAFRVLLLAFLGISKMVEIALCLLLLFHRHKNGFSVFPPWYRQVEEIALISWAYFNACDPLPPCIGKVTNWLGSFFGRFAMNSTGE